MSSAGPDSPLPFSRALPPGLRPAREMLELPDGCRTAVYVYSPPEGLSRRLPVLYLHGIQSHPGWFCGSAAALAEAGHAVLQVTRRGSGESRDDRGHAASAGQLLGDVAAAARLALARAEAGRLHLLGVSWGGKLAAAFAANRPEGIDISSLTLVAPGIAPRVDVSRGTKLAVGLWLLLRPRRLFDIPLNDEKLFTDNEEMRQYLRADAFRLHRATARLLYASRRLDGMLRRARRGSLTMPTTLILAARDRIIDNAATRRIVERLTAGRCMVEEFHAAHTLEFEPDPRPFYESLRAAAARAEE